MFTGATARLNRVAMLIALLASCAPVKRPPVNESRVRDDLTDQSTGKVRAGDLGRAELSETRVIRNDTRADRASLLVDVTAKQSALGEGSTLTAHLRLSYEWRSKEWLLSGIDEVRKWTLREPKSVAPGRPDLGENESDSSAIQGLMRAKRLARRNLGSVPVLPPP